MKLKAVILAVAAVATVATSTGFVNPAAAAWGDSGLRFDVQGQKGRGGQDNARQGRESRPERRGGDERRERLSDDERRALHRDLDKAKGELYKPRPR
jgi:hypothetical protein